SSRTICAGESATYTVSLTAEDDFSSAVALEVSGLPSGATASFDPEQVTPSETATLTIDTETATTDDTYTITVTGTGDGKTDQATATLIISSEVKPDLKPFIKIISPEDGTEFKGKGLKVPIKIEYYTPDTKSRIIIKEYVPNEYYEYIDMVELSSKEGTIELNMPALPVYNCNGVHIIEVEFNKGTGKNELIDSDKVSYTVKPATDTDMIILTNPYDLKSEFSPSDWLQILNDIQLATDDGGILLYTSKGSASEIRWEIFDAVVNLQPIDYLFIIGGEDVIPYDVGVFNVDIFNRVDSVSDQPYWAFATGGHMPEIRYARLPTISGYGTENTNKRIFDTVLQNEIGKDKNINAALLIGGRHGFCVLDPFANIAYPHDSWFTSETEQFRNVLTKNKGDLALSEYKIDISSKKVESTYTKSDAQEADLIVIVGHGSSWGTALYYNGKLCNHFDLSCKKINMLGGCLYFYNSPDYEIAVDLTKEGELYKDYF
ncbi:hypothetical protein KA005_69655, partial [bacterium]|nr:hypothetical protein [bacterium]